MISDGVNNKAGSLFAPYEFFYSWRKTDGGDLVEADGINSLHSLIQGMFQTTRLLDVIRNFIFFPDTSRREEKVLCRYPQYYCYQAGSKHPAAHADRSERRRSESNRRRQRRNVLWCHRLRQKLYHAVPDAVADEKRFEKVQPERRGARSRNVQLPFSKDSSHSISILNYAINRCRATR